MRPGVDHRYGVLRPGYCRLVGSGYSGFHVHRLHSSLEYTTSDGEVAQTGVLDNPPSSYKNEHETDE